MLSLCLEGSLGRIQQRPSELTEENAPGNLHFATLPKSLSDGLCEQMVDRSGLVVLYVDYNTVAGLIKPCAMRKSKKILSPLPKKHIRK